MKTRRGLKNVAVEDTLSPNSNANAGTAALGLRNVIDITSNVCIQKNICQHCGRGDRYGIPLHFLLHYPDGGFRSVCFTCGKKSADETGLLLPLTPLEIEEREEQGDLRLIKIAIQKMEGKNGNI